MKSSLATCVGVAASMILASVGWAQSDDPTEVPDHSLSEWKLGSSISGPQVTLDALEGKVVAIEYWGIN